MSRYFPHPPYAEDQPYAYTILTTHVLHRGFQVGALLGATTGLSYSTYRHFRPRTPPPPPTTPSTSPLASSASATASKPPFRQTLLTTTLRTTGLGATFGLAFLALGLTGRMWGKQEIEWQDRAWRLLANEGQVSTDDWSLGGMALGAVLAVVAARRGALAVKGGGVMAVVGAAGLGSLVGTEASVEWRAWKGSRAGKEGGGERKKRLLEE